MYRQAGVAALLGRSKQAVSADAGRVKLDMRDGTVGYPVFQFDGRRLLPGIRDIVKALAPVVATPWPIASWSTSIPQGTVAGGRFDLAAPMGTCYLAITPAGAVLEALQMHLTGLPIAELAVRRAAGGRAVRPLRRPSAVVRGLVPHTTATLHDDHVLHAELARFGVHVRGDGQLPFVDPSD